MWSRLAGCVVGILALGACGSMDVYGLCDSGEPDCFALPGSGSNPGGGGGSSFDQDGDGFIDEANGGDDCDDGDDDVYPGAEERCDDKDNDCDGKTDEDEDGDGARVCDDCDDGDDAVFPGAPDVCGDDVDSDCDGLDCSVYVEDFEGGSLGAEWSVGGTVGWSVQSANVYEGSQSAASGLIGNDQNSTMTLTLDYAQSGTLSFWFKVSSEIGFDDLEFYVDGSLQSAWNGEVPWQQHVVNVPSGQHTFQWRYVKDGSLSLGSDKSWVDLVEADGGTP